MTTRLRQRSSWWNFTMAGVALLPCELLYVTLLLTLKCTPAPWALSEW
jgi:hypothetical protein